MRRREFIAGLGGAAAWPVVARAQQSVNIPRIGALWPTGNEQGAAIFLGGLRQELNDSHPPKPPCSAGQTLNLGAVAGWLRPFSCRQKKPRRVWRVRAGPEQQAGAHAS